MNSLLSYIILEKSASPQALLAGLVTELMEHGDAHAGSFHIEFQKFHSVLWATSSVGECVCVCVGEMFQRQ